jgi:hypothetical protein
LIAKEGKHETVDPHVLVTWVKKIAGYRGEFGSKAI